MVKSKTPSKVNIKLSSYKKQEEHIIKSKKINKKLLQPIYLLATTVGSLANYT